MGKRGPAPGFKKAREAAAAAAAAAAHDASEGSQEPLSIAERFPLGIDTPGMTPEARENPAYMTREQLIRFAHSRNLGALSELRDRSDDQIRHSLQMVAYSKREQSA